MSCSLLNESILLIHKFGFFFAQSRCTFTGTDNSKAATEGIGPTPQTFRHLIPVMHLIYLTRILIPANVITRSFFNERIHIWGKRIRLNVIAILLAVILVVIDFLMDKRWILTPINFYPSFTNTATNQISQYRTTMILQEDAI